MLPKILKTDYKIDYFPSTWQTVLFRNYGRVPVNRLAKVLNTETHVLEEEAENLGIKNIEFQEEWETRGYISIIRRNWHLLNYRQLLMLLDVSSERLEEILENEDGLNGKLGGFKPYSGEVYYTPLTKRQKEQTAIIKRLVEKHFTPRSVKYFDFFSEDVSGGDCEYFSGEEKIADRIIYSYTSNFGDVLSDGNFSAFSDNYLKTLSDLGINGIWIQGILWKLTEFPLRPQISRGFTRRLKNLNRLIGIAAKHNIKLYLYLNEPRAMPIGFFDEYPHLKGTVVGDGACLCTSQPEIKSLIYEGVKKLCESAPELGGIITITMSENLTNCYSPSRHLLAGKKYEMCPVCKSRSRGEVATEVVMLMDKGVRDAKTGAKLIAWNWGWSDFMGWTESESLNAIVSLPLDVTVMSVSEDGVPLEKQGIRSKVADYSISNIGPGERTKTMLAAAKASGHRIMAKVQINNSWECAAVPFIPVFELIYEHLSGLLDQGINGIMLSWTLGGYPSLNLSLAREFYSGKKPDIKVWYNTVFEDFAATARAASRLFSEAFREFPFDLEFLYTGPQNYGCANIFYGYDIKMKAGIIGFPYEDIETWRGVYPKDILVSQLKILSDKWRKGVELLDDCGCGNGNYNFFKAIARTVYCHFYSSFLITEWVIMKERQEKDLRKYTEILDEEFRNTLELIGISGKYASIGFEASNHYLYDENTLLEKLINIAWLKDKILTKNTEDLNEKTAPYM